MQSKTSIVFLFFILTSLKGIAQKDTMYLNANGEKVDRYLASTYQVRTVSQKIQAETIEEFDAVLGHKMRFYILKKMPQNTMGEVVVTVTAYQTMNGQTVPSPKNTEIFTPMDSVMLKYGSFMEWYPSGSFKTKGTYSAGRLQSTLETFHPNDKPKQVEVYSLDTLQSGHSFDSLGIEIPHSPYFQLAKYPKGVVAMFRFLGATIRYPLTALEKGIQETIFVGFTIEKNGKVGKIKIEQGKSRELNDESIRVIQAMPKWTPAKLNGEPIEVRLILPIKFKIE
jgi:TonB family protein